jgi:hypothetical protein
MDIFAQIVVSIISQQESIIGPIAVEQAQVVPGLSVDWGKREATLLGDKTLIVDTLVAKYKELFGKISVEVCKEATASLVMQLSDEQRPKSLA